MDGSQFGKYSLLEHMGKGGVASVFRASDNQTGTIVAVKIFESDEARPPEASCLLRDREVKMLVSVQHPNIVRFFEAGEVDGDYYYAMEFVENSLLTCMRQDTEFTVVDKVHILRQSASAMMAIHRQGIVHRDIKPGNILLDQDPNGAIRVKLTDLGIAKNVSEVDVVREAGPARVAGTAKYLSPEQIRRDPMDGRSDVFSLGVVAYELITGTAPFKAEGKRDYLAANVEQVPPPVDKLCPEVPRFLAEMVDKMLAKNREDRYDSETLARDLELTEQHLISGAPLVENVNPASMFFEPLPTLVGAGRPAARQRVIKPMSYAMAVVMAGAGAGVVFGLWPWPPRPPVPAAQPEAQQPRAPEERLQEAASAAQESRHWQAFALLAGLKEADLPEPDRSAFRQLALDVEADLADAPYRAALKMLKEGRQVEADIVLQNMSDLFPDARQTALLKAEAAGRQKAASEQQRWAQALADTYDLVSKRRYKEALEARRKLVEDFSADPERVKTARRTIADLLTRWADDLAQGTPEPQAIEEFLSSAESQRSATQQGVPDTALGELRLKLGQGYRARDQYGLALRQYDLVSRMAEPTVAQRGIRQAEELRRWLTERPQPLAEVAAELQSAGLGSPMWQDCADTAGGHEVTDGVLHLRSHEGSWGPLVGVETIQPIRHFGFTAGVSFRPTAGLAGTPGTARAGIAVTSTNGNSLELSFDGARYAAAAKSGAISAGGTLRSAVGDEAETWHKLALRYEFDAARLTVFLDDAELKQYPLELSDVRIRLFLTTSTDPTAGCDFRDVFCRP
jgi:hypothetical protein